MYVYIIYSHINMHAACDHFDFTGVFSNSPVTKSPPSANSKIPPISLGALINNFTLENEI